MSDFEIRLMSESDKPEVFALMKECLIDEYNAEGNEEQIDSILSYYEHRSDSVVICLFVDSNLVGFMWTLRSEDIISKEPFCFGLYLAVKKIYRGKKYSRIIYDETLKYCKQNGLGKFKFTVRANNETALGLHYTMGAKIEKYEMNIDIV